MKNIVISLIVDGAFKNVLIPREMVNELAFNLRKEGKYAIHTSKESYVAEGFVVIAKASNKRLMLFSDDDKEGIN